MEQQPPASPQPTSAQPPPPVAAPPAGWAPAATTTTTTAWVMPAEGNQRGTVTGAARLGAGILILFGAFWTLVGAGLLLVSGIAKDIANQSGINGLGDLTGSVISIFGVVILVVALVEIATGVFAWRGTGLARVIGILYGLVFGLGALLPLLGTGRTTTTTDTTSGIGVLVVIAVAYLYTALVFIVRYRSRP